MRPTTFLTHTAALALAAASMLVAPLTASAQTQTYTTKPCMIVPGTDTCASSSSAGSKLPSAVIATKRTVETRGVSQPNLKPNICNSRPEKFKGCQVF